MKLAKTALIVIQLLVMVNAFGGGIYGMLGAPAVPASWLDGSPFHSYFVPGLFLFAVIGGGMLVATAAWVRKSARAPWISLMMGAVVMLWIVVQVAIIGWTSPLQPISFVAGAAVAALAGIILRRERRAQVAPVA
ncbi:MAG TPA: hypothetical protein VMH50_02665 [Thermoleophilia bacterium]|nr:hypothetical protein [Thermoleophilia bacterium]